MTTTIGDPLGHPPGFVPGEEEEEGVDGEGRYESDSDDDGDVDRYVFLARQPAAPAGASVDDDDDAVPGGGGRKRHHLSSEILVHAPPASKSKKDRLALPAPRGASAEESGSEEAVRSPERFRGDLDRGKKNKKRRRCGGDTQVESAARGKKSRVADSEAPQHRDLEAAAARAPRRYPCSISGRCFASYQALGGHVHFGHAKEAKDAIGPANRGDVAGNSCRYEMVAMADGHGKEPAAVAANPGESHGDGNKTNDGAACRQDVDSSSGDSNEEQTFIDAANHRGHGNVQGEMVTAATSHGEDDGNGTERKAAVGNGSSVVRRQHRCGACGKEYPSGKALGGHMRKHRKLSPHNSGKEQRSLEVGDGVGHQESGCDGKMTLLATACRQDVDSCSGDSNSNEEMFIDATNHHDDGNVKGKKVTVATSHDGDDGDGTERKAAIGNGISAVRKAQHRCGVCGKEYLSGKALGGHMNKHRKLSPHAGGYDGHGKKSLDAVAYHQDVDCSSGDSKSNEEMFTGAADHNDHRGDGGVEEKVTVDDADGTERNVAVGRCHELVVGAIGNTNSTVRKTRYRCEVCGKEYLSGQALGGHMRMHRKKSPDDGGKERRSPEVDGIPDQRALVITATGNRQLGGSMNTHYGTPFDGSLIGWL